MNSIDNHQPPAARYHQIGVSRPALEIEDLPTPEEAFKVKRIGWEELILVVLGPSIIALGVAIGSGEWLLGPLNVGTYGFKGIGWVILVSILLQVFYNVELARFTIATGEPPIVAFGRVPPGFSVGSSGAVLLFPRLYSGWLDSQCGRQSFCPFYRSRLQTR
jgi:hypothetical protein